jgi:peroxiredoxin (alkyl hydroperoxide reductase subunit C)
MNLRPGIEAPDFILKGFHKGEVKDFKLSDFKGKWVVICFYPADFTFV